MRTFSALKRDCAHPELLKLTSPKNYARDKAADLGTEFHSLVEKWVKGEPLPTPHWQVAEWFTKLRDAWSTPPGCSPEVAIGLDHAGVAWEVEEPKPHVYVRDGVDLATAGRLDLRWYEDDGATLVVVDLKTGQSYLGDPWDVPQLRAQAVAALSLHNATNGNLAVDRVKLGVYYARLGIFDYGHGHRGSTDVENLWDSVYHWATMDNSPRPGAHCLGCWDKKQCDAFAELIAA